MCGRYSLYSSKEDIESFFEVTSRDDELFQPSYNVPPGTVMPIVLIGKSGQREIGGLRWGLIPKWADSTDTGYKMINARAETLLEKKSFKGPFQSKRCLVPANGFFEWKKSDDSKQPFFVRLLTSELMAFAGLFEHWVSPEGEDVYSYTIVTTESNTLIQPLHERMPVILPPEQYDYWLDPNNDNLEGLQNLLQPFPMEQMSTYRVTTEVNTPKNNYPELLQPIPK